MWCESPKELQTGRLDAEDVYDYVMHSLNECYFSVRVLKDCKMEA
jgi:hypothetical protein